jgi:hypothetical protein
MGCLKLTVLEQNFTPLRVVQRNCLTVSFRKVDSNVENNPIRMIDPDGRAAVDAVDGDPIKGFFLATGAYLSGVANAVGSNSLLGAGRQDPSTFGEYASWAQAGQTSGDVLSVIQGGIEMAIGGGGTAVATASGVGVVATPATVALGVHGATTTGTAMSNLLNPSRVQANDGYAPNRDLPRNSDGTPNPKADGATGAHTQLGTKQGSKGPYRQAREFDNNGNTVKDIDFTDHGRPQTHPNPHQHRYTPNSTGGTPQRSKKAEPLHIQLLNYRR